MMFHHSIDIVVIFIIFYNFGSLTFSECQLVINVKNQGGDIVQESITSNITDDTITLEFQRPEGTLITQFVDFKSVKQILPRVVLESFVTFLIIINFSVHFKIENSFEISTLFQKYTTLSIPQ